MKDFTLTDHHWLHCNRVKLYAFSLIIPRLPNSHDNQQDHLKPKVLWGWLLEPSCLCEPSCLVDVQKDHCEYHEEDTRRVYVLKVDHWGRLPEVLVITKHTVTITG